MIYKCVMIYYGNIKYGIHNIYIIQYKIHHTLYNRWLVDRYLITYYVI